jgi:ferritin-like metal-binding protein YciE
MNASQEKVLQYLGEAQGSEQALVRVLQSQIAMTPRGGYRGALERHLRETRDHAQRIQSRLRRLGAGGNPVQAVVGVVETAIGQALALGKTPLDLLRGTGGEEKVLKNAKDAAATEALEIATYTALERLANAAGDTETAALAASIRGDEEKMLQQILREIPKLTDAVVGADVKGSDEPWPGYDELTANEVQAVLSEGDDAWARQVRTYERAHKNRAGVLRATERELSSTR